MSDRPSLPREYDSDLSREPEPVFDLGYLSLPAEVQDAIEEPGREPFRILVTGSRNWTDRQIIETAITRAASGRDRPIVVHGACRAGADAIADRVARELGIPVERHPASWARYSRAAGPIRNAEMVALGAGICLAFIRDGSPGTTHCAELANQAGIPVRRFTVWDALPPPRTVSESAP